MEGLGEGENWHGYDTNTPTPIPMKPHTYRMGVGVGMTFLSHPRVHSCRALQVRSRSGAGVVDRGVQRSKEGEGKVWEGQVT
jgi:hypothetical protein